MSAINDPQNRKTALDPRQSFIVQAPAGSGKTELLTQRYLQLLAYTEKNPEEIIAITFTRKAVAEMRQRIIDSLQFAANNPIPKEPHKQTTWKLAKKALARDQELCWGLQKNPNRLRILTIDALSAYLVKQMPISSKLSLNLEITERPQRYYQEAIEQILLTLETNPSWKSAVETLLLHLDNRVYLLTNLLIAILSKRDQWLPHITGHQHDVEALREQMENALRNIALDAMQSTQSYFSEDILSELIPLADFAGRYCRKHDTDNPIAHCKNITTLSASIEELPAWLGVANLLLTQKGEWRKTVTKRQGFPTKGDTKDETEILKTVKQQMTALLANLSEKGALKSHLHDITQTPPLTYNEQQWEMIKALITLLPILAAQLNVLFMRDNVTDFVELTLAALRALGHSENPTDLALHLDYRINHLLIDEFQDTSVIQFQLIEKLIAGWQSNDGRTLLLVGDPMQSIYRFRNAEVGLFLRAQEQGIAQIPLTSLILTNNFRSSETIVNWNNERFRRIFPTEPDMTLGATPYTPATATQNTRGDIQWHPSLNDDGRHEADQVIQQIQKIQTQHPEESVVILVRSRTHLADILRRLHEKKITFQAIDLDPLSERMEIQDIHSLARALLHRADQIAWLALLRAPCCGLMLNDLYLIAEKSKNKTIWSTLKNQEVLTELSEDAQQRLQHCIPALYNAIENIGRAPFSHLLRSLWETLYTTRPIPEIYLQLIETLETQPFPLTLATIQEKLKTLYAEPNPNANTKLQIMTIHKAKGLEFDHVLLPGLHHKAPYDKHQILKWLERPKRFGDSDLILAPIKAADQQHDPTYTYLQHIEKTKTDFERARLFYVAATRAKKSLHLFANATLEEESVKPPSKGTFLKFLWDDAKVHFTQESTASFPQTPKIETQYKQLHRFTKAFFESRQTLNMETTTRSQPIDIALQDHTARSLGTIIHEALEHLAQYATPNTEQWPLRLKQFGIPAREHDPALKQIQLAIERTQQDPRGQWILSKKHQEARSEFPLTFMDEGQAKQIIIDRCFIDEEGARWIIDYKTAAATSETLNGYKQQLETYAKAFQQYENRPIQLALYFPISGEWIEWTYAETLATLNEYIEST